MTTDPPPDFTIIRDGFHGRYRADRAPRGNRTDWAYRCYRADRAHRTHGRYWADRTNRSYRTCGRYRNLRMCSADEKYPSADHTTLRNR